MAIVRLILITGDKNKGFETVFINKFDRNLLKSCTIANIYISS